MGFAFETDFILTAAERQKGILLLLVAATLALSLILI
jgi:hypothetical protein